jgi:hypothetical protein
MKEIFIICNSPQALMEVSSGRLPSLHQEDLFTCNNAFTFFKTSGRHLNFFTDTADIIRHVTMPEVLSGEYHKKVEHIFSRCDMKLHNGKTLYHWLRYSPVTKAASSAIGALAYLANMTDYDCVWLVGYTLDERENSIWNDYIDPSFHQENVRPFVYKFDRK